MEKLSELIGSTNKDRPIGDIAIDPNTSMEIDNPNALVDYVKRAMNVGSSSMPTSREFGVDMSTPDLKILGDEYDPTISEDYMQYKLYENQSNLNTIAHGLYQFMGEAVGSTLESTGYMLDIPNFAKFMASGEGDFTNYLAEVGTQIKESVKENNPVYTSPTGGKFDMGSLAWYAQNLPSIASTLALMYPAAGATRLTTGLLKGIGLMRGAVMTSADLAISSIIQAMFSRQAESIMEGRQSYDETLKKYIQKGYSAKEAKEAALSAFKHTYWNNWPLVLQDIPQYLLLNKLGLGAISGATVKGAVKTATKTAERAAGKAAEKAIADGLAKESWRVLREFGYDFTPAIRKKAFSIARDMAGEAFEEGYQFVVQKRADKLADYKHGLRSDPGTVWEDLGESVKDGEFWTAAFWGAAGAGVMMGAASLHDRKAATDRIESIKNDLDHWGTMFAEAHKQYEVALQTGDPVKIEFAFDNFVSMLATKAAVTGNSEFAKKLIDALATGKDDPFLIHAGVPDSMKGENIFSDSERAQQAKDMIDKAAKEYKANIAKFNKQYKKNKKKFEKASRKVGAKDMASFIHKLAMEATQTAMQLNTHEKTLERINAEAENMADLISNYDEFAKDPEELARLHANIRYAQLQKLKNFYEKMLKDDAISEAEKAEIDLKLAEIEAEGVQAEMNGATTLVPEDLEKAAGIKAKQFVGENVVKELKERLKKYNSGEYIDDILKSKKTSQPTEESKPKKGSIVMFEDENGNRFTGVIDDVIDMNKSEDEFTGELDDDLKKAVEDGKLSEEDARAKQLVRDRQQMTGNYNLKINVHDDEGNKSGTIVEKAWRDVIVLEEPEEKPDTTEAGAADVDITVETDESDEDIDKETEEGAELSPTGSYGFRNDNPGSFFTYFGKDKDGRPEIFNKELERYLNRLTKDEARHLKMTAEFKLDTGREGGLGKDWKKIERIAAKNGMSDIIAKVKKGEKLTNEEAEKLLQPINEKGEVDENGFETIVDLLPIKIDLSVRKAGNKRGKTFRSNIYFKKSKISPVSIKRRSKEDSESYEARVKQKRDEVRAIRRAILMGRLTGRSVFTNKLKLTSGQILSKGKKSTIVNYEEHLNNAMEVFKIKKSTRTEKGDLANGKFSLAISRPSAIHGGMLYYDRTTPVPGSRGYNSTGAIYLITNDTMNGEARSVKLNRRKLSRKHSAALLEALRIMARAAKGKNDIRKGYYAKLKELPKLDENGNIMRDKRGRIIKENRTGIKGLTVGQIVDILVEWGGVRTDPDNPESLRNKWNLSEAEKNKLRDARLYVSREEGTGRWVLYYGRDMANGGKPFSIPLEAAIGTSDTKLDKEFNAKRDHFIEWAMENKVYSNLLESKRLGSKLNERWKMKFDLLGLKHDGNGTYGEFLLSNGLVGTDAEIDETTGKPFHTPSVQMDIGSPEAISYDKKPTEPKPRTGEEREGTTKEQLTDREELFNLFTTYFKEYEGLANIFSLMVSDVKVEGVTDKEVDEIYQLLAELKKVKDGERSEVLSKIYAKLEKIGVDIDTEAKLGNEKRAKDLSIIPNFIQYILNEIGTDEYYSRKSEAEKKSYIRNKLLGEVAPFTGSKKEKEFVPDAEEIRKVEDLRKMVLEQLNKMRDDIAKELSGKKDTDGVLKSIKDVLYRTFGLSIKKDSMSYNEKNGMVELTIGNDDLGYHKVRVPAKRTESPDGVSLEISIDALVDDMFNARLEELGVSKTDPEISKDTTEKSDNVSDNSEEGGEEVKSEEEKLDEELEQDLKDAEDIFNSPDPFDDGTPFRRKTKTPTTPEEVLHEQMERELKWARKRLGIDDVTLVDRLEQLTRGGRKNWGIYTHAAIYVYRAAEAGTVYHEAFHRVDLGYLLPEERRQVYADARRRMGKPGATDAEVREWLADKFAEYMLSGKGDRTWLQRLFDNIRNFIYKIFVGPYRLNNAEVDRLFSSIARGRYKASQILDINRGTSYDTLDKNDPDQVVVASAVSDNIQRELYGVVIRDLTSTLLTLNKFQDYSNVTTLNYDSLIKYMENAIVSGNRSISQLRSKYLDNKEISESKKRKVRETISKMELTLSIYKDLLGPKDEKTGEYITLPLLKSDIETELIMLGFNVVEEEGMEDNEQSVELGASEEKSQGFRTELEVEKTSTATAITRLMVSTLSASNKDKSEYQRRIGVKVFVDEDRVWNNLMSDMAEVESVEEMFILLERLAAKEDKYFYKELADRLRRAPSHIRYQVLSTIRNHHYRYLSFRADNIGGHVTVFTATERQVKYKTMSRWNESLMFDQDIFRVDKEGRRRVDTKFMNYLTNRVAEISREIENNGYDLNLHPFDDKMREMMEKDNFKPNKKSFNDLMRAIAAVLNDLHIDVTWTDIKSIILKRVNDGELDGSVQENTLYFINMMDSYLLSKLKDFQNVGTVGLTRFLFNNVFVSELAEYFARNHPELHPSTINGPSNNGIPTLYYVHGNNTHASTVVRKLKRGGEYLEDMANVTYNRHSIILQKLLNDRDREFSTHTFNIFTFLDFAASNGERRKYTKIFGVEDTLMRIGAVMNGFLPLPVMADRAKYFYLKVSDKPLFNKVIKLSEESKKGEFMPGESTGVGPDMRFSDEVLDVMYGYFLDEKNRIDVEKELIHRYATETDPAVKAELKAKLIKNYHYTGDHDISKANATKFTDFKVFNEKINGKTVDEMSESEIKEVINEYLLRALTTELESLVDKGMLYRNEKKGKYGETLYSINSKALSLKLLGDENSIGSENGDAHMLAATFMINNMVGLFESQKLFSGDPAYYETDENGNVETDMYKRTFGIGSSGVDIAETLDVDEINGERQEEVFKPTYNSVIAKTQTFESVFYKPMFNKYVENFKQTAGYYEITDDGEKAKIQKRAEEYAELALKPYRNVDPTDGQLLITPEMFRSIYRRMGKFTPDVERAYNVLMNKESGDINEAMNVILRPIKTVYFGNHLEDGRNHIVYDKMAMAVIFPATIKGTHLEDIYDWMTKNDVQVIRFDSAIKVGAQEAREIFKDGSKRNELNDFTGWPIYKQYFRNLRYQVEVSEHADEKNLVSSQVPKVVMSDIDPNKMYGNKTGAELLESIVDSRKGIVEDGARQLESILGIRNGLIDKQLFINRLRQEAIKSGRGRLFREALRIDENGEEYLALDAFPDKMWFYSRINSLIKRHVIDLVLPSKQFVQISDYGRGKKNPKKEYDGELEFMKQESDGKVVYKMKARVSASLFSKIIPGFDQMTKREQERIVKNKVKLLGFRVPTQGKSSVVVIEIEEVLDKRAGDVIQLPLEFTALTGSDFDIDKLFVIRKNYDYSKKGFLTETQYSSKASDEELYRRKVIENFVSKRGLFDEGFASNISKIVAEKSKEYKLSALEKLWHKLYNAARSDKIRSTSQSVDLINKLNEIKVQIDTEKEKEYYAGKNALYKHLNTDEDLYNRILKYQLDNGIIEDFETFKTLPIRQKLTRKALENKFIDALFDIMTAPESFEETTLPLGYTTNKLKEKAAKFRKISGDISSRKLDMFQSKTISYQSSIKSKYVGAKSGTSSVVLYKAHHTISQLAGLRLATSLPIGVYDSLSRTVSLSEIKDVDGEFISQWFSGLIDAHVDATKDPYISDLNVNESVYHQLLYLLRIGMGERSFDFILEPIIRDYSQRYYNNIGDITVEDISNPWNLTEEIILKTAEKWLVRLKNAGGPEYASFKEFMDDKANSYDANELMSTVSLEDNKGDITDKEFIRKQLQILSLFKRINIDAKLLNDFVVQSRIDVAGYGINPSAYRKSINKLKSIVQSGRFINADKIFNPALDDDYTSDKFYYTSMIKNGIMRIIPALSNVSMLASNGFELMFSKVLSSLYKGGTTFNERDIINLNNEFYNYLYSGWFLELGRAVFGDDANMATVMAYVFNNKGGKSVFQDLSKIKDRDDTTYPKWLKESTLISNISIEMLPKEYNEGIPLLTKLRVNSELSNSVEEQMAYDWERIMNDEDPKVREFGAKLLLYNFFTSGQRILKHSLTRFIPPSILKSLEINGNTLSLDSYVKGLFSKLSNRESFDEVFSDFRRQVAENIPGSTLERKLLPTIRSHEVIQAVTVTPGRDRPEYVITSIDEKSVVALGLNDKLDPAYTPYIQAAVDGYEVILEYVGYSGSEGKQVWRVLNQKGFRSQSYSIHEYGNTNDRGIFSGSETMRNEYTVMSREDVLKHVADVMPDVKEVRPEDSYAEFDSLIRYYYEIYNNIHDTVVEEYSTNADKVINKTKEKLNKENIITEVVGDVDTPISKVALDVAESFGVPRRGTVPRKTRVLKTAARIHNMEEVTDQDYEEFKTAMESSPFNTKGYIEQARNKNGSYIVSQWKNIKSSDMTLYFTYRTPESEKTLDAGKTKEKGLIRNNNLMRVIKMAITHGKPVFIVTSPENAAAVQEFVNMIAMRSSAIRAAVSRVVNVVSDPNVMAEIVNRGGAQSINMMGDNDRTPSLMKRESILSRQFLASFYKATYDVEHAAENKDGRLEPQPTVVSEDSYSSKDKPLNIYYSNTENKYSASMHHGGLHIGTTTNTNAKLESEIPMEDVVNKDLARGLFGLKKIAQEFAGSAEHIVLHVEDPNILNSPNLRKYVDVKDPALADEIDLSEDPINESLTADIANIFKDITNNGGSVTLRFVPRELGSNFEEVSRTTPNLIYKNGQPNYEYLAEVKDAQENIYGANDSEHVYNEIRSFVINNVRDRYTGIINVAKFSNKEEEEGKDINKKC